MYYRKINKNEVNVDMYPLFNKKKTKRPEIFQVPNWKSRDVQLPS